MAQILQLLGVQWREASLEERAMCEAEADKDKVRYTDEVQAIAAKEAKEEGKPAASTGAPTASAQRSKAPAQAKGPTQTMAAFVVSYHLHPALSQLMHLPMTSLQSFHLIRFT